MIAPQNPYANPNPPSGGSSRPAQSNGISGTYTGYYTAAQGKTGVTIEIYEDLDEYWGDYYFYNLDGYSNAKDGAYHFRIIKKGSNSYEFRADSWIEQPSGYEMLSWDNVKIQNGKISGSNGSYILRCEKTDG